MQVARKCANSPIHAKLRSSKLPSTFQTPVEGSDKIPNYLIGDPAYPLLPFCMKEYEACTSKEQVICNNMLRSARNQIKCGFGRFKVRWSIVTAKMDLKLEALSTIIYACFVLHNYCEKHNVNIDEDLVIPYLPLYKATFYSLKTCPKNRPRLIHGSKTEIKKTSGQISIIIVLYGNIVSRTTNYDGNEHPLLRGESYGVFSLINLSSSS